MNKFEIGEKVIYLPSGVETKILSTGLEGYFEGYFVYLNDMTLFIREEYLGKKPSEPKKIVSVCAFRLKHSAGGRIPYNTFNQINEWLKAWIPAKTIEAIICKDIEEGLKDISEDFSKLCRARFDVSASEFEVQIGVQELKGNRFWIMAQGSIHGTWYQLED